MIERAGKEQGFRGQDQRAAPCAIAGLEGMGFELLGQRFRKGLAPSRQHRMPAFLKGLENCHQQGALGADGALMGGRWRSGVGMPARFEGLPGQSRGAVPVSKQLLRQGQAMGEKTWRLKEAARAEQGPGRQRIGKGGIDRGEIKRISLPFQRPKPLLQEAFRVRCFEPQAMNHGAPSVASL